MTKDALQYWEVWDPRPAATGMLIARGQVDHTDSVILHSAPDVATVEISDNRGVRLAYRADLERTAQTPMCRLRREGASITREDIWPQEEDLGGVVLLPVGEAGLLKSWWHADDHMDWRWQVEFYNSRR